MQHHSFFRNYLPVFKSYHLSYCTWDTFDFPNPSSLKDEPAIASLEIFFNILKFKLGFEAWGNETKEITLRLRNDKLISFVLFPLASGPC